MRIILCLLLLTASCSLWPSRSAPADAPSSAPLSTAAPSQPGQGSDQPLLDQRGPSSEESQASTAATSQPSKSPAHDPLGSTKPGKSFPRQAQA